MLRPISGTLLVRLPKLWRIMILTPWALQEKLRADTTHLPPVANSEIGFEPIAICKAPLLLYQDQWMQTILTSSKIRASREMKLNNMGLLMKTKWSSRLTTWINKSTMIIPNWTTKQQLNKLILSRSNSLVLKIGSRRYSRWMLLSTPTHSLAVS